MNNGVSPFNMKLNSPHVFSTCEETKRKKLQEENS